MSRDRSHKDRFCLVMRGGDPEDDDFEEEEDEDQDKDEDEDDEDEEEDEEEDDDDEDEETDQIIQRCLTRCGRESCTAPPPKNAPFQ